MPTPAEVTVMRALTAIEIPAGLGRQIEAMGSEAVTVACEAALGTYPGLAGKVRGNAIAVLGEMTHPQARETVRLLLRERNEGLAIRAMRAAGAQRLEAAVDDLGRLLDRTETPPLLAAEALKALMAIDSPRARTLVERYVQAGDRAAPHRASQAVRDVLQRSPRP